MSDSVKQPVIVCEQEAVGKASEVIQGYRIQALPRSGRFDHRDFDNTKVILWPDATPESRSAFKKFAGLINDLCLEIKLIVPNGKPHGWNLATGLAEGSTWPDLAVWAKGSMMVFAKGEFPTISVEVSEAPDPVPASVQSMWEQIGIAQTKQGVINNADNVVRLLAGWAAFKDIIWYDEFHQRYFTKWNSQTAREWADIDDTNLTVLLQREFGFPRINEMTVSAGVRCRGHQCHRNEPRDWLGHLKWDGQSRIDTFFHQYFGAQQNGYTAAVSRNFWIGMVARIYHPGCQLDNMVILEGRQGIYKSKGLEAIGGKWYMEASEEITSKDFFVALAGKLIVEIADLDSFSRADTTRIKKVITCRTDRYRQPYARASQDHPRQSIFVGTTNEQHYLKDATGARRFWPITCGRIELDRIKSDRDQLFAEAVTRYISSEDWYRVPEEATLAEQESRRAFDEWENIIQEYLIGKNEITITELAASMGFEKSKLERSSQMRMGTILRHFGWERRIVRRGASILRVWVSQTESSQLPFDAPAPLEPLTV